MTYKYIRFPDRKSFPAFPPLSTYTRFGIGQTSDAERKDVFPGKHLNFPGKRQKEIDSYEQFQQQPAEYPPGP
jgi:hypothetical protein